jgi:hypothetical protein
MRMSDLLRPAFRVLAPLTLRRLRRACADPMRVQARLLSRVVQTNAESAFGRRHRFAEIDSIARYRSRLPLSDYEAIRPYVDAALQGEAAQLTTAPPVFFAMTSGTTGEPKYLPVTAEKRASTAARMRAWLSGVFADHPEAFRGRFLTVVSPETKEIAPCGRPVGAESGHTYRVLPGLVKRRFSTPDDVFTIPGFEAKYYTILRLAAAEPVTMILLVNPSTLLLLAERLGRHGESIIRDVRDGTLSRDLEIPDSIRRRVEGSLRPDAERARLLEDARRRGGGALLPKHVWPDLAALGCWKGGSVGMYVEKLARYFPEEIPVRELGYLSSEHQGSIPLSDEGDAGVLAIEGNFFEFYPADRDDPRSGEQLVTLDQLVAGRRYFVFVTTPGGLYRYDMNDIVEVAGFFERTPMIRFIQKGRGVVSFTGEKLYECQVVQAARSAFEDLDGSYEFIAAVGEFREGNPRYTFLVEFDEVPTGDRLRGYLTRLDGSIRASNLEYREKRDSGRLDAPALRIIRRGEFDRYRCRMVERHGRQDGQFKILRLTSDHAFRDEFETIAEYESTGDVTSRAPRERGHSPAPRVFGFS